MLTPARYYDRRLAELIVPRIAGGRMAIDPEALQENLRRRLSNPPVLLGYSQQPYAIVGWTSHPWLHRLEMQALVVHAHAVPLVA
jgi:poly(3-hydroxyoctanoate) depolymerase